MSRQDANAAFALSSFLYGGNATYIEEMYNWISTHDVAYQTITYYCPHGVWQCGLNQRASDAYRRLFGQTPTWRSGP